jgi:hypothetical protein
MVSVKMMEFWLLSSHGISKDDGVLKTTVFWHPTAAVNCVARLWLISDQWTTNLPQQNVLLVSILTCFINQRQWIVSCYFYTLWNLTCLVGSRDPSRGIDLVLWWGKWLEPTVWHTHTPPRSPTQTHTKAWTHKRTDSHTEAWTHKHRHITKITHKPLITHSSKWALTHTIL